MCRRAVLQWLYLNENLRLKSVIERSKNGYHRRDTFHRRGDVVATIYAVGFAVLGFGLATLAVFHYLGAFWGVAWLVFWGAVFFWGVGSKDEQN